MEVFRSLQDSALRSTHNNNHNSFKVDEDTLIKQTKLYSIFIYRALLLPKK